MTFTLDQGYRQAQITAASQQELADALRAELPATEADRVDGLAMKAWAGAKAAHGLIEVRGEG